MNSELRGHPLGQQLAHVMASALAAIDPHAAVQRSLRLTERTVSCGGFSLKLTADGRVFVVGAGKACFAMTRAVYDCLGDLIDAGVVVVKDHGGENQPTHLGPIAVLTAAHPVPDQHGVAAAERIAALASSARSTDLVIALISGGASSLIALPAPGLTLADLQAATDLLLKCGAPIAEINIVRKHCTQLSGGRLAQLAGRAHVLGLIVSDVVGSSLGSIGSGPTAPNDSTYSDAIAIVQKHGLADRVPKNLTSHLQRGLAGACADTTNGNEAFWPRVCNHVVASNVDAAHAAKAAALAAGFDADIITTSLIGAVQQAADYVFGVINHVSADESRKRPVLLIFGGETTVEVNGDGKGGRNQELALRLAQRIAGMSNVLAITLATDGEDGPTDAAGAAISGRTISRAEARGLDANGYLARNDSYRFFDEVGGLLKPGPTGTNANDLLFALIT